jgi:hypothetical protein
MSGPPHVSFRTAPRRGLGVVLVLASACLTFAASSPARTVPDTSVGTRIQSTLLDGATGPLISVSLAGGQVIRIGSAPGGEAAAGQAATILGALLHGPEMQGLIVRIVSPATAMAICHTSACYMHDSGTIVIPASDTVGGMPFPTALAHEYGHHIANRSNNAPWEAIDRGPKRWSTAVGVCSGVAAGTYLPGDEGAGYWDNPGEAFAQAYALAQFPGSVPWWWHLPAPDATSLAALRADVVDPWQPHRTTVQFAGPRNRHQSIEISPALDGEVTARIIGHPEGHPLLKLRSEGGVLLARSRHGHGRARLSYTACRSGPLRLSVGGTAQGRVRVRVQAP